jgi:hypothetical protein
MHHKRKALTRRDFLRGTIGATLGASMLGPKFITAGHVPTGASHVTIVRDQNAMDVANTVDPAVLKAMLDETLIK